MPPETLEILTNVPMLLSKPSVFDVAAAQAHLGVPGVQHSSHQDIFALFTNLSSSILMMWHYSGTSEKSGAELDRLTRLLVNSPIKPEELIGFLHTCEEQQMDKYLKAKDNPFQAEYGWHKSSIKIRLPKEKVKFPSESDAPEIMVGSIWHRDLTDIIVNVFQSDSSHSFHMTPFTQCCKISEDKVVDVYSETCSSLEMLQAYEEINSLPWEAGDDVEHVVTPLMLWSDATHLTNFGDASMWSFYLFFGNQSKYTRGKPELMACHYIAYIPKVSDFTM